MKEEMKLEKLSEKELLKLIYEGVKNNKEEIQNLRKEFREKFEYLEEKIKCIDEKIKKIEDEIKYLDEKIDNTKNQLVLEISEELKNISEISTKSTDNLKKKIDNEIEDRKVDVSKLKDFNRIILNDIRGRISILEEESEKYNPN